MTTRIESEEIETTRSEKALAFVLAAFILVGGLWAYFKLDEVNRPDARAAVAALEPEQRAALDDARRAERALFRARRQRSATLRRLEIVREDYRTALDAGQTAPGLRAAYAQARTTAAAAQRRLQAATERAAALRPKAREARGNAIQERRDASDDHDLLVLGLRLGLIIGMLAGAYGLLSRLRAARSRYLPAALAWIGAAAALALVMAADYTSDAIDVTEVGPLALSIAGIALTLVAFAALQSYLAQRVPLRRVRRGECPFCGYPGRGNNHCEGCGRRIVAECASCYAARRVGTEHCASCGRP